MKQPENKEGLIEYERFVYPDGQPNIRLKTEIDRKEGVDIACRVRNPNELFDLLMVADIVNRQSYVDKLVILYLMGGRTDRVLSFDQPFTLRIVADMVNTIKARKVEIIEPHSKRTVDLINNSIATSGTVLCSKIKDREFLIATPDKGAAERYKSDIVCSKVRDTATGKLSGFKVDDVRCSLNGETIVLMDDLIDGGGTFVGIHEKLKDLNPSEIYLVVTHAIQEKGLRRVSKAFDKVLITNSFKDWQDDDEWVEGKPENLIVSEYEKEDICHGCKIQT